LTGIAILGNVWFEIGMIHFVVRKISGESGARLREIK